MPLVRRFLGWDKPLLAAAVADLSARYCRGQEFDLSRVVVVTPGAAAGRRMLELLVDHAESSSLTLTPPRLVTQGALPELLYEAKKPFAGPLNQELAWVKALMEVDRDRLASLLPHPPEDDDLTGWRAVAKMLGRLRDELAADSLDVNDVLKQASKLPVFNETDRWRVLDELLNHYLQILDNLELWDKQKARLVAIEQRECRSTDDIILVGTADMNRVLRDMLDQVSDKVTALVFAPESLAPKFDGHGCLIPPAWQDVRIGVKDEQLRVVDSPGDQADGVMRWLASLEGDYSAAEITIGTVDERLVPHIQQRLAECGLRGRFAGGTPLSRSSPYQFLDALAEFVERRSADSLSALVRHPTVEDWLRRAGCGDQIVAAIDDMLAQRLPSQVTDRLVKSLPKESTERKVLDAINSLAAILQGAPRSPADWSQPILDTLLSVFGQQSWNVHDEPQRHIVEACEQITAAVQDLRNLRGELTLAISAGEAIRWVLEAVGTGSIPPPADRGAIEMLGWLELPLDDAPALVLAGFNEGIVPSSRNGDMFLPDTLRRQLNLEDNALRYARDAYALSVLLASSRQLQIIVGRRTVDGDPLLPSRLLFATEDKYLAPRALACFQERPIARRIVYPATVRPSATSRFAPRRPEPLSEPVTSMRVTEFRDYLACPYRYYLRHRLRLEPAPDAIYELDALQFGECLHQVLNAFAESDLRDSADQHVLGDFLIGALDDWARRELSERPWPAVSVQLELARQRLRGFARWQAFWREQGNQIVHAEIDRKDEQCFLLVDGAPMRLRGRIDRIDYNAGTREWFIFDYKTSAEAKQPHETHRRADGRWTDLQLPLYRHLARGLGVEERVTLGYVVLPASVTKAGFLPAPWGEAELAEADEVAAQVVRDVRAERFWPPSDQADFGGEFAPIVGDDRYAVAARQADGEEPA